MLQQNDAQQRLPNSAFSSSHIISPANVFFGHTPLLPIASVPVAVPLWAQPSFMPTLPWLLPYCHGWERKWSCLRHCCFLLPAPWRGGRACCRERGKVTWSGLLEPCVQKGSKATARLLVGAHLVMLALYHSNKQRHSTYKDKKITLVHDLKSNVLYL